MILQPDNPSLPLQLIQKTIEQGAVYVTPENSLSCFQITSDISLSATQQLALNLCLANTPLMVIQGVTGSGKTRLAQVLARGLIAQQKRILILTHYPETRSVYYANLLSLKQYNLAQRRRGAERNAKSEIMSLNATRYDIPIIPFSLSESKDYDTWLTEQVKQQYLGKLPMDFLPLHLLPDALLGELRTPQKLEKWLHILQDNHSLDESKSLLSKEFPEVSEARLNLLAYSLQKLFPLLQKQLWLHQLSGRLSEEAQNTIFTEIKQQAVMPILGTVSEFLQPQYQQLWEMSFDCVIVEEAEYLSWEELTLIAGVAQKLILLGNLPLNLSFPNRNSFSKSLPLDWLGEFLLPAYRYRLTEQFRLHSTIARPIFKTLYSQWIHSQPQPNTITLPQLTARLQMMDVRGKPIQQENPWEGKRLLQFMSDLGASKATQIGILAFTEAQKNWLQNHCSLEYQQVFIGSFADWVGKEINILLVSCVGYPEQLTASESAITLTRASDYLILFGDYQLWTSQPSPMQDLLFQPELQREREVSLL